MKFIGSREVRIAFLVLAAALGAIPAAAQLDFYSVTPCRVYDSRGGAPLDMWDSSIPADEAAATYTVPVADVVVPDCGAAPVVPADAVAVSLNLTIIGASKNGYLQAFPAGTTPSPRPTTPPIPPIPVGALSFGQGKAVGIFQIVLLGTGVDSGKLSLLATVQPPPPPPGTYHIAIDVVGYFEVNDPPTITSSDTVSVPENQTAVIDVQATDPEGETEGAGLTYSLTGGADQALFSIVPATGVLTFNSAPDFESPGDAGGDNVYDVQVTVTDSGAQTDVQDIQVTVIEAGEPPTITSSDTASVPENQTAVIDVQSTDPDGDAEGSGLTYSLTGGADQALFSILPATGVLTFNSAPDFENPGDAGADNVYDVQVTVTDSDTLTDVQDIQVTVTAVDEPPTITSSDTVSAQENQTAVIDVQSTDPEGDIEGTGLIYSKTGGADQALFALDTNTGVLTFLSAPNFEAPADADTNNVYLVQVTVTDSDTMTDVQDIQVTVTNQNEAPTITSSDTASVPENQTAVIDVQSTDPDGETESGGGLTYSKTGGADQALFALDTNTGVLTFLSAPNFEAPADADTNNVYLVQVTVTDAGTLTDVQDIQVTLTDENEAPSITSSATPSVPENQTAVIDIQSTDPDGETENGGGLTYSKTGGADQALFALDTNTGVLTFLSAPDFEAPADADTNNVYLVQVTVTDAGTLTGVQNLQVTLTDENEAPSITSSATPSAQENQTAVIDIQSTDPDGETENGGGLTYSKTGGADQALFALDTNTGVLTFLSAPNFEAPADADANNVYLVQVTVTDAGTLTGVQDLQVTVTNDNEPPTANADGADITEEAPNVPAANTVSGDVLFNDTDPDVPPNLTVSAVAGGSVGSPRAGTYGSVTINSNGSFTYTLDDNNAAVNSLAPGGTLTDAFGYTASDGEFTSSSTLTVTIHGADDPPTPDNDAHDFIGNTQLEVDRDTASTPEVIANTPPVPAALGVLDGDVDVDGGPISISGIVGCGDLTAPFDCVVPGQGTVSLQGDGSFSFIPEPGDADPTASFQYTLTGNPTPATVTLTRFGRVWYVKNDDGGGTGVSSDPFATLAEADAPSVVAGDTIYVYFGDGTTTGHTGGILLEANQRLIGEGVQLDVPVSVNGGPNPTVLRAAGSQPLLDRTAGTGEAVRVNNVGGVQIRGLSLAGNANAIDVTTSGGNGGGATISNNTFRSAGAEGIDVNAGGSGAMTLDIQNNTWNVAGTHTGNAVDLARTAGTMLINFSGNTNILSAANAVNISGGAFASTTITGFSGNSIHGNTGLAGIVVSQATFDSNTGTAGFQQVDGDNLAIGTSVNVVGGAGMSLTSVQGNLFFDDLDIFANTSGLTLGGAGGGLTFAVTPASPAGSGTSVILANGGAAVDVSTATVDLRLDDMDSTTTGSGVSLTSVGGTFSTDSDASISKTSGAGTAFVVASSSATVTYAGPLNVTSGGGVSLTGNSGSVNFSGQLTLSTGANPAFSAIGGGTVTATNTGSTLTTSSGTALNVNATVIGASDLNFKSITQSGGTSAIVLNNTGTVGGLNVTGTGTTTGSGGAISNTSGDAISLTSTRDIVLKNMNIGDASATDTQATDTTNNISGHGITMNGVQPASNPHGLLLDNVKIARTGGHGINGTGGNVGLSLNNVSIFNAGDATLEDAISMGSGFPSSDMLTGTVSISNSTFAAMVDHGFQVENAGSGTLNMTITTVTMKNNDSIFAGIQQEGSAIQIIDDGSSSAGTPTTNLTVNGLTATNIDQDVLDLIADPGGVINVIVNGNGITANCPKGDNVLRFNSGSPDADDNASFDFDVQNVTVTQMAGTLVQFKSANTMTGSFRNSTLDANDLGNTLAARGIEITADGDSSETPAMTIEVDNVTLNRIGGDGIQAFLTDVTTPASRLDVTIKNCNIGTNPANTAQTGLEIGRGNASANEAIEVRNFTSPGQLYINIAGNNIRNFTSANASAQGIDIDAEGTAIIHATASGNNVLAAPGATDFTLDVEANTAFMCADFTSNVDSNDGNAGATLTNLGDAADFQVEGGTGSLAGNNPATPITTSGTFTSGICTMPNLP